MFRRRRGRHAAPTNGPAEAADLEDESVDDSLEDTDDTGAAGADEESATGPWDVDAAPDDEVARVDLGALRVPTLADVELRVEADPQGQIVAVALVHGRSAMQLGVFAAPRSEGIWNEVREEIDESLRADGGVVESREGEFGTELWARVDTPDGKQALRFVGVDGPRWFLRALFTGAAATDPAAAPLLTESLRQVVVVRGSDPMPVRDPLTLRLPKDVIEQAQGENGDAPDDEAPAKPAAPKAPRRGPEISEIG